MKIRVYNRHIFTLIVVFLFMVINFAGCALINKVSPSKLNYSDNIDEFLSNMQQNKSEIDYKSYINVEMKESHMVFNKTNEQQTVDKELNNLMYQYRISNKTDKPIKINYKILFPKEMTQSIIVTNIPPIEPKPRDVVLEAAKGIGGDIGALMVHFDKLNEEQKKIFYQYKDTLCFEVHIGGKKAYFTASPNRN